MRTRPPIPAKINALTSDGGTGLGNRVRGGRTGILVVVVVVPVVTAGEEYNPGMHSREPPVHWWRCRSQVGKRLLQFAGHHCSLRESRVPFAIRSFHPAPRRRLP